MTDEAVVRELLAAARDVIDLWDSDRMVRGTDFEAFTQQVVEFAVRSDAVKVRLRAAVARAELEKE